MATFTALFDACVFYPAPLRDFLMQLAGTGLFRARWTEAIHEEWIRSVLADRPTLDRAKLDRTRNLMNAAVLDCVVTGYEPLIAGLTLPDAGDRHVLAAAIKGRADVIVTFNLRDFPEAVLGGFGIQAQHPDDFAMSLFGLNAEAVHTAAKTQRARLKNPPMSVADYLATMEKQQMVRTVARLRDAVELI